MEGESLPEPNIIKKVKIPSELGKKLRQIRQEIIAEGLPLLDVEAVEKEKAKRRGG